MSCKTVTLHYDWNMNPDFRVALELRKYNHSWVSAGSWFQEPLRYHNPWMHKPLV